MLSRLLLNRPAGSGCGCGTKGSGSTGSARVWFHSHVPAADRYDWADRMGWLVEVAYNDAASPWTLRANPAGAGLYTSPDHRAVLDSRVARFEHIGGVQQQQGRRTDDAEQPLAGIPQEVQQPSPALPDPAVGNVMPAPQYSGVTMIGVPYATSQQVVVGSVSPVKQAPVRVDIATCPQIYSPVIGSDGRQYANACEAGNAGVTVTQDLMFKPPVVFDAEIVGRDLNRAWIYNQDGTKTLVIDEGLRQTATTRRWTLRWKIENGTLVSAEYKRMEDVGGPGLSPTWLRGFPPLDTPAPRTGPLPSMGSGADAVRTDVLTRWPLVESGLDQGEVKADYRFGADVEAGMARLVVADIQSFMQVHAAGIDAALRSGDASARLLQADTIAQHVDAVFGAAVGLVGEALQQANAALAALAAAFGEMRSEFAAQTGQSVDRLVVDRVVAYGDAWQVVAESAAARFDRMGANWRRIGAHIREMMGNERQLRQGAQAQTQQERDAALDRVRGLEAQLSEGDSLFEKMISQVQGFLRSGRDAAVNALKQLGKAIPEGLGFGLGMVAPLVLVALAGLFLLRRG